MGEPEDPGQFVAIQVGEWGRRYGVLYVDRDIWERLRPSAREFAFYVEGVGRCRIAFDRPAGRLEAGDGQDAPGVRFCH
jgi:hypothetical protein